MLELERLQGEMHSPLSLLAIWGCEEKRSWLNVWGRSKCSGEVSYLGALFEMNSSKRVGFSSTDLRN